MSKGYLDFGFDINFDPNVGFYSDLDFDPDLGFEEVGFELDLVSRWL